MNRDHSDISELKRPEGQSVTIARDTDKDQALGGREKTIVVAIHGVGDPGPANTVERFAYLMAEEDLSSVPETVNLNGAIPGERFETLFPVHIRRSASGKGGAVFAELYWADLVRTGRGTLQTIVAYFRLAFNLWHTSMAAARSIDGFGSRLGGFARTIARILYGPVAALNLLLLGSAMVCAVALLLNGSFLEQSKQAVDSADLLAAPAFLVLGIVGTVVGLRFRRHVSGDLGRTFFGSLAVCSALATTIPILRPVVAGSGIDRWLCLQVGRDIDSPHRGFPWYSRVITEWLNWAWVALACVLLLAFTVWVWSRLAQANESRPSLDAAYLAAVAPVEMWPFLIPTFWIFVTQNAPEGLVHPEFRNMFKAAVPTLGITAVTVSGVVLSFAVSFVWNRLPRKSDPEKLGQKPKRPRLLINPVVTFAVAFSSFVRSAAIVLIATVIIVCVVRGETPTTQSQHRSIAEFFGIETAMVLLLIVGTILVSLRSVVEIALFMGLDVAEFFRVVAPAESSLRLRVQDRLTSTLRWLVAREQAQRVVFVGHSQGSVLAIDWLRTETAAAVLKGVKTELVTMGSPYGHIYQYYFPRDFPSLEDSAYQRFHTQVARWQNLYRTDDYVGTNVESCGTGSPVNIPIAPAGHTGYWSDREVKRHLEISL